jgi:hypothetical protein
MSSPVSSRSLLRRGTPRRRWVLAAAVFGSGTPLLDVTVVGIAPSRRCQSRARSLSRIKVSRASRRHSGPPRRGRACPIQRMRGSRTSTTSSASPTAAPAPASPDRGRVPASSPRSPFTVTPRLSDIGPLSLLRLTRSSGADVLAVFKPGNKLAGTVRARGGGHRATWQRAQPSRRQALPRAASARGDRGCPGSFDGAVEAIERGTGQQVGKRQVEELAQRSVADFDAFYSGRQPPAGSTGDALVLSCDGKGVVLGSDALRGGDGRRGSQDQPEARDPAVLGGEPQPQPHGRGRHRLRRHPEVAHTCRHPACDRGGTPRGRGGTGTRHHVVDGQRRGRCRVCRRPQLRRGRAPGPRTPAHLGRARRREQPPDRSDRCRGARARCRCASSSTSSTCWSTGGRRPGASTPKATPPPRHGCATTPLRSSTGSPPGWPGRSGGPPRLPWSVTVLATRPASPQGCPSASTGASPTHDTRFGSSKAADSCPAT